MNYSKIEEVLDLFLQTITRRLEENKKENNFCEIPPVQGTMRKRQKQHQ